MRTYRELRADGGEGWFDVDKGKTVPVGTPLHRIMESEIAAGQAVVEKYQPPTVPERRARAYRAARITPDDAFEAIIEQLATLPPPHQPKFAALLARRQAIRDQIK